MLSKAGRKTNGKYKKEKEDKQRMLPLGENMATRKTNGDETGNNKTLGIAVALILIAALALTIVYSGRSNYIPVETASGTTPAGASGGMPSEGFSSYEEMMEAHHGGSSISASNSDGCGGVAAPSSSVELPSFAGQTSEYGITYDSAGYDQLLKTAQMRISAEQTKEIVGLNIQMPCCGVTTLQASGNCGCGHHVALEGLAKLMASKGYTFDQIQPEIDKWKQIFYPGGVESGAGACG